MKFHHDTGLEGVVRVEPRVFRDSRGFFLETWHREKFRAGGIDVDFVQDNHSRSVGGTLRGLHAQLANPQGKLVRAVEGAIWDVAVDIRRGSPTFGRWYGAELSAGNFHQVYIPPGYAHGFCVLSDMAQVEYKCTAFYDPASEIAIRWDDPELAIHWPLREPLLSAKDAAAPGLAELMERLPVYGEGGA
jgi:dTDP-4-dehydrorhamnose 3,5-epimerase